YTARTAAVSASPGDGTKENSPPNQPPRPETDRPVDSRLRDLDAGIEAELEAAMGGLSEQELYGDLSGKERRPESSAAEQARKKGRILSIHGQDVFIDVPGGRSQGVLSLAQFPEGPPKVGAEIEIDIEGYDKANGLLLLTRKGAAQAVDWSTVAVG